MALLFVLAGKLEAVSSCTNMGAGCGWVVKLKASDGAARTSRDTDRSMAVTSYAHGPGSGGGLQWFYAPICLVVLCTNRK